MSQSQEIVECLGDDALQAFQNGGEWEWSPDCAVDGSFIPYNCGGDDGCTTFWHGMWYVSGYRIENGHLYEVIQSCDSDGNWEFEDECDVDDTNYEEWRKDYDYTASEKAMQEYYRWVLEHNEEPLGEFYVTRNKKRNRQVTVHLVDGQFIVKNPSRLHPKVREYLFLDGNRLSEIDWKTIDDFVEKCHVEKIVRKTKTSVTILVEVEEPLSEKTIVAQIRKIAKRNLK